MNGEATATEIIKERLSSPITGTYILSWLLCNWQISLIVLFSGYDSEYKIQWVTDYLTEKPLLVFGTPLIFTIGYVLGMPFIREFYNQFIFRRKIKTEAHNFNSNQDIHELKMYRQTILNIAVDLIRTLEQINRESDIIVAEIKTIGVDNFTKEDVEQLKKSAASISHLVQTKQEDLKPLFNMNNTSFTVKDQVENFQRVLSQKQRL